MIARGWYQLFAACLVLAACGGANEEGGGAVVAPAPLISGYAFLTAETQALQDDTFENPGYLWVDRGRALFNTGERACASCHEDNGEALHGAAARYPAIDAKTGQLLNLEGRINQCRVEHQDQAELDYESDDLLGLTAFVANLSNGVPVDVSFGGRAQAHFERGQTYFNTRRGQFDLACSTCHNDNWGKKLRGDTISQGHGNGFPAYRLEWEGMGSLHRRFRDCDLGVRAEPYPAGSETYLSLELYLAARAEGLEIETPAVRR